MIVVKESRNTNEWDDFILENDGHPLQLSGWGDLKSKHGWIADRLFITDNDEVIGAIQVLTKKLPLPFRAFSYAPRNTVFHVKHAEGLEAVAMYIKHKYKGTTLSIEPDTEEFDKPEKWTKATNKVLPAETIVIDLQQAEDAIQAAMAKKTRQYIRKSAKDVEIKQVVTPEDVDKCFDLYKDTAQRAGFALHTKEYYLDVKAALKDHSPIFAAYIDDEPVAFLWLAISGATAYELYGGMNDAGQKYRANYALKWHAITKTKEWGLTKYDFGGLISGGVTLFKQGWVGESTTFAGTYDRPLSPFYVLWSHALPFAKRTAQRVRKVIKR